MSLNSVNLTCVKTRNPNVCLEHDLHITVKWDLMMFLPTKIVKHLTADYFPYRFCPLKYSVKICSAIVTLRIHRKEGNVWSNDCLIILILEWLTLFCFSYQITLDAIKWKVRKWTFMEIESCVTCISNSDAVYLVTSTIEPSCAAKTQDSTEVAPFSSGFWGTAFYQYEH